MSDLGYILEVAARELADEVVVRFEKVNTRVFLNIWT